MADPWFAESPSAPARKWLAVTPSDATPLDPKPRALYIGGAGNLTLTDGQGNEVAFVGVPAGAVLSVSPSLVKSTGTTATNIVALY